MSRPPVLTKDICITTDQGGWWDQWQFKRTQLKKLTQGPKPWMWFHKRSWQTVNSLSETEVVFWNENFYYNFHFESKIEIYYIYQQSSILIHNLWEPKTFATLLTPHLHLEREKTGSATSRNSNFRKSHSLFVASALNL